ncbi:hypothetical protein AVEN_214273-1 [Araneus ventricosus]|uniref:Uncharacterized protein n=1 Tax=Araneus ventricosus TaxID=182803 RepID=A0A4Y1ZZ13_ARAVE|nr:hypothetical protein AVEN_214273-1 [Araneus ventricosus]
MNYRVDEIYIKTEEKSENLALYCFLHSVEIGMSTFDPAFQKTAMVEEPCIFLRFNNSNNRLNRSNRFQNKSRWKTIMFLHGMEDML